MVLSTGPIGPINQDTTIKAITIGPGKLNSDVVTFTIGWRTDRLRKLKAGGKSGQAHYRPAEAMWTVFLLFLMRPLSPSRISRTLVPVRFVSEALGAQVVWHPERER